MKIEGARYVAVWIEDDDPGDMDPKELLCRHALVLVDFVQPRVLLEATFTIEVPR